MLNKNRKNVTAKIEGNKFISTADGTINDETAATVKSGLAVPVCMFGHV